MATEATFDAAATAFDGCATDLRDSVADVDAAWGDDVVVGGRLARTVERAVDATHVNTMSAVAEFEALADECRRRAAVCAEYTAAMTRFRRDVETYRRERNEYADGNRPGNPPRRPAQPIRPAPWVDESPRSAW